MTPPKVRVEKIITAKERQSAIQLLIHSSSVAMLIFKRLVKS